MRWRSIFDEGLVTTRLHKVPHTRYLDSNPNSSSSGPEGNQDGAPGTQRLKDIGPRYVLGKKPKANGHDRKSKTTIRGKAISQKADSGIVMVDGTIWDDSFEQNRSWDDFGTTISGT